MLKRFVLLDTATASKSTRNSFSTYSKFLAANSTFKTSVKKVNSTFKTNEKKVSDVVKASDRFFSNRSKFLSTSNGKSLVAINPSVQIHKCEMTEDTHQTKNECFILMHKLRKDDVFPENLSKEKMIELFFPQTTNDMALALSSVTSAFYGVMLETCGKVVGFDNIDNISKDFFYKLGRAKSKATGEAIDGKFNIPKDARGVVILLVSAIYNASPEYKFQIKQFSEEHCEIELRGVDRYYRITKALNIDKNLQWPVLHRFMEGISDEIHANVNIKSEMLSVGQSGECHEKFTLRKR